MPFVSMRAMKVAGGLRGGGGGADAAMKAKPAVKAVKKAAVAKDKTLLKAMKAMKESPSQKINRLLGSMKAGGMAQARYDAAQREADDSAGEGEESESEDDEDSESSDEGAPMKKPAAAGGKTLLGGYEDKGWRNRGKTKALERMEETGELPSDIAKFLKAKKTKDTTTFTNQCIHKVDGKWPLKLDHPLVSKARSQYEDESERVRVRTVPSGKAAYE